MIYIGNNEIADVRLGSEQIIGIYCGEYQIFPMGPWSGLSVTPTKLKFKMGGGEDSITIRSSEDWSIKGGEDWFYFSQDAGTSGTTKITVYVDEMMDDYRWGSFQVNSDPYYVEVGVEQVSCEPIVAFDHVGEPNNRGDIQTNFYIVDSGVTIVDNCTYDLTGMKSICHRWDSSSFYQRTPVFSLGSDKVGTSSALQTVTEVNLDIPTVEVISYPFGNDRVSQVSQSITSVTFTSTDNVYYFRNVFYYMQNLKSVKLGNLSGITTVETPIFNSDNTALTDFEVDSLPNLNMSSWGWSYLTNLTEQSVINILNALKSGGGTITLGSTNLNKLTSPEGQAALQGARSRGWTVN